tara:strand:+ start:168 stop:293 length:126 start_codon:yes stop_codon:yes gene_type:complete
MSSKFFGNSKQKQPTTKGKKFSPKTNTKQSSSGVKKAGRGK